MPTDWLLMRFRRVRVLVALAALFIAVTAVGWLYYQSGSRPTADEENIAALVFNHAIEQSADCSAIFLSFDGGGDPTDAFMERFAGNGQRIKKGSHSGIRQIWGHTVSTRPSEAKCKLLLRFDPSSPVSSGKALAHLATYTPQGLQSSYSYRLARRGNEWVITDARLVSIV